MDMDLPHTAKTSIKYYQTSFDMEPSREHKERSAKAHLANRDKPGSRQRRKQGLWRSLVDGLSKLTAELFSFQTIQLGVILNNKHRISY